jgi:hypothetical protein
MLHQFLIERREEVLRDAGALIRRLRPSPCLDAARDENLSAFLEAVIDGLKRRESLPSDPVPSPVGAGRGGRRLIRIEVEDGCGGLEPGAKEIIFAPFAQANGDRSGLGLGLSIAREIIVAHGGTLGVQDLPGIGCIFQVDLPGQKSAAPQARG